MHMTSGASDAYEIYDNEIGRVDNIWLFIIKYISHAPIVITTFT